MIICHCRNISDKDFENSDDLLKRLLEADRDCCSCIAAVIQDKKRSKGIAETPANSKITI